MKNESEPIYTIDTLLYVTKESSKSGYLSEIKPCMNETDGVMHVVPIQTSVIKAISSICIYLPQNLQSLDARQSVLKTLRVINYFLALFYFRFEAKFKLISLKLKETKKRTKGNFPLLDPVEDMGIKDKSLVEIVQVWTNFL